MPSAAPRLRLATHAGHDSLPRADASPTPVDLGPAARTHALFRQFRALSQRLGRNDGAQREALGLTEAAWRAWVAAQEHGGGPVPIDHALAGRIAWQNHLSLGLLALVARFGAEAVPVG